MKVGGGRGFWITRGVVARGIGFIIIIIIGRSY